MICLRDRKMKKFLALLEVLLVYFLLKPLGWWLVSIGVYQWEVNNLGGWSYLGGLLNFIVPGLILVITKRDFKAYGITLKHWKASLDLAMSVFPIKLIPWILGIVVMLVLGASYTDVRVSLVLTLGYLAAILLLFFSLRNLERRPIPNERSTITNGIVLGMILIAPLIISFFMQRFSSAIVSTVIWQMVFSGIGEEFKWRGYYQSRLNEGFGKPFRLCGIAFGPGLIITALLFGLSHAMNTFNPLIGQWTLQWEWALFTFFSGLFFGIVREKSQDIVAPGILHGVPDAFGEAIGLIFKIG